MANITLSRASLWRRMASATLGGWAVTWLYYHRPLQLGWHTVIPLAVAAALGLVVAAVRHHKPA